MKKTCLIVGGFALIALLTGIPVLIHGIAQRGPGGVNYGRVLFPLLLSGVCFYLYKKK